VTLIVAAVACTIPGVLLRVLGIHLDPRLAAVAFGFAVVGAAFLLSWGAEVAQHDISQALALTILALIAVLPEYAVDAYLAWQAASDPEQYGPLALANMTGANRLLIGIAWPLVVFLYCWRARRLGKPANEVSIGAEQGVEVAYLAMATLYSFIIPLKGTLSLIDLVVLVTIFGLYVRRVLRAKREDEPELIGPAKLLGALPTTPRRFTVVALFLVAATVIFLVAEPFAESLIEAGVALGLPKRTLIQWLAPFASEAPEFIITGMFAWRLLGTASLGTLVSSKVNQWTLLVSTIPLVFNIASWRLGKPVPAVLPLDAFQREDLLLTSAQSLFAVALLLDLRLSWQNAASLLALFLFQLFLPDTHRWVTAVYLVLAAYFLVRHLPNIRAIIGVLRGGDYVEPPPKKG
jgi:cation:H+ antiporter